MSEFSQEHVLLMKEAIKLFNEKKYWECHEELEHLWLEDRGDPIRNIYWAIIQVAASMIHVRDENLVGAYGMMRKAQEKFTRCDTFFMINELVEKKLSWKSLKNMAFKITPNSKLNDFSDLYRFKFNHFKD